MRRAALVPLLCVALSCGSPPRSELTVLAASSLTEPFEQLARDFERAHPGVDVTLSFAGSHALATQVRHGIDADVIASADARHLRPLVADGLAGEPRSFARTGLVLVVGAKVPLAELRSLPEVGSLVVGVADVPIGGYTAELFDQAQAVYGDDWRRRVESRVVSREANVRMVASKVSMGEADAAVVYRTDAAALSALRVVELPDGVGPSAIYVHATLAGADDAAVRWLELVESAHGQEVLAAHGFEAP